MLEKLSRLRELVDSVSEAELTEWVRQAKIDYAELLHLPEPRAMFSFLETLTLEFRDVANPMTEPEWTAFRALCRVGAVEGIIRFELQLPDRCHVDFVRVQGDYLNAPDGTLEFDKSMPCDDRLQQAKLTGLGERWAGYLDSEKQVEVLCFISESPPLRGHWTPMLPESVGAFDGGDDEIKPPSGLTPALHDIWDVVVTDNKKRDRLSSKQIESCLNVKGVGQNISTLEANLAVLTQRLKVLSHVAKSGYGLPGWK